MQIRTINNSLRIFRGVIVKVHYDKDMLAAIDEIVNSYRTSHLFYGKGWVELKELDRRNFQERIIEPIEYLIRMWEFDKNYIEVFWSGSVICFPNGRRQTSRNQIIRSKCSSMQATIVEEQDAIIYMDNLELDCIHAIDYMLLSKLRQKVTLEEIYGEIKRYRYVKSRSKYSLIVILSLIILNSENDRNTNQNNKGQYLSNCNPSINSKPNF